jgi:hypothetical protein
MIRMLMGHKETANKSIQADELGQQLRLIQDQFRQLPEPIKANDKD